MDRAEGHDSSPLDVASVRACPACGSDRRGLIFSHLDDVLFGAPGRWNLQECVVCGTGYLDPRPNGRTLEEAYKSYYTHSIGDEVANSGRARSHARQAIKNGYLNARYGYSQSPAWRTGRYLVWALPGHRGELARWIMNLHAPTGSAALLDVGCGSGTFLGVAKSLGWSALGVEPDAEAAAAARASGHSVVVGDIHDRELDVGAFEAVTMRHVIEHLPDPRSAVARALGLLESGGRLVIATPNFGAAGRHRFGRSWRGLEPPRHFTVFTRRSLIELLTDIGFARVEDGPFISGTPMHQASRRVARLQEVDSPAPGLLWSLRANISAAVNRDRAEEVFLVAHKG